LMPYVTDLEFEVDRLRKQGRFIEQQAWDALNRVDRLCDEAVKPESSASDAVARITETVDEFSKVLADLHEQPGFHPAHDLVVPIAVRPLIEQVFRSQQRLAAAPHAVLRLELDVEHLDWFPARLRHIVDNLIANALKYSTAGKGETRVTLGLRRTLEGYELRIADNGVGISADARMEMLDLLYRAGPARAAGLGVGLAVVKLLIEQSGGTLIVESVEGQGTSFLAFLPRYDINDSLGRKLQGAP